MRRAFLKQERLWFLFVSIDNNNLKSTIFTSIICE